jgi:hypothetical protein
LVKILRRKRLLIEHTRDVITITQNIKLHNARRQLKNLNSFDEEHHIYIFFYSFYMKMPPNEKFILTFSAIESLSLFFIRAGIHGRSKEDKNLH